MNSIGQNIKRLRRERDITQETLAEYLGITAQAVSGWETDRNAPDIAQLPLLANIFAVTTDEILGVNVGAKDAKIREICDEAQSLFADGKWDDSTCLLRRGLLTYPNAYPIMTSLCGNLYCQSFSCTLDAATKQRMLDDALDLGQKVLAECADINTRALATDYLCSLYDTMGKKEKAIDLAMTLPELSRANLLRNLYEGEQLTRFYRENLLELFSDALYQAGQLAGCVDGDGNPAYTPDEQLAIHQKIVTVYELLFEDGDYNFFAQFPQYAYRRMARLYAAKNDRENTLDCLRKAMDFAKMFCEYPENAVQTSMLFRGVSYGGWVKSDGADNDALMREVADIMNEQMFDFLRDDAVFREIQSAHERLGN